MKTNLLIFVVGFIIAFAGGYFVFSDKETKETTSEQVADGGVEPKEGDDVEQTTEGDSVPSEAEPIANNNCLSCHAVEALAAPGGTTGPDLSNAFNDVPNKHGKSLDEFLQEPTTAVMASVIEGNPLSEEERKKIVEALQKAAGQ